MLGSHLYLFQVLLQNICQSRLRVCLGSGFEGVQSTTVGKMTESQFTLCLHSSTLKGLTGYLLCIQSGQQSMWGEATHSQGDSSLLTKAFLETPSGNTPQMRVSTGALNLRVKLSHRAILCKPLQVPNAMSSPLLQKHILS